MQGLPPRTSGSIMHNYPEMIHLMSAGSIIGAIAVPIDPRTKGDKLAHMISNSKSRAVFITADLLHHIEPIMDKITNVKRIFTVEKPHKPATGDNTTKSAFSFIASNNSSML